MNQVTVYVSRNFTLNRPEKDPIDFRAGVGNIVDADVAAHPFVAALTVGTTESGETQAVAELRAQLAEANGLAHDLHLQLAEANERAVRAENEVADLTAQLAGAADAESKIAELQATVAAYAAMQPADAPKAKK